MNVTGSGMTGRAARPGRSATPMVTATWQAESLDTAAVQDELGRLWAQVGGDGRDGENGATRGILMRANTLNLIAVARSAAEAARVEAAIVRLTEYSPSRAIVLITEPGRNVPGKQVDVRVGLLEIPAEKGRPAVRFEHITLEAGTAMADRLASLVPPLLITELPDVLWWPGDSLADNELFADLTGIADRLIVDTAALANPGPGLHALANCSVGDPPGPRPTDFCWARLTPWRHLIAQFFDQPAAHACLDSIEEATIIYAAPNAHGESGLTAATMIASWLATRLGWQAPGELVRGGGGWRLTLRAGGPGQRREILLTLRPTNDLVADRCLQSVTLVAHGEHPGSFTVERTDALGLMTTSQTPTMPRVSRMVHSEVPDDPVLLADALQSFHRDRVYEEALAFAAGLLHGEPIS